MQRDTKIRMIGKLEVVEAILEIDSDLGSAPELTAADAHRIFSLIYICICMCVCMCICTYVCMYVYMHVCKYVCMYNCMHECLCKFRIGAQTK